MVARLRRSEKSGGGHEGGSDGHAHFCAAELLLLFVEGYLRVFTGFLGLYLEPLIFGAACFLGFRPFNLHLVVHGSACLFGVVEGLSSTEADGEEDGQKSDLDNRG